MLNLDILCSNMLESSCRRFEPGQVYSFYIAPVHSAVGTNEYLAVDNGKYLLMKNLCTLIAA